jgi:NADH dehydrogenase
VVDQTGAVIVGAKVVVTGEDTGMTRTNMTNSAGVFLFTELPVGSYRLVTTPYALDSALPDGALPASSPIDWSMPEYNAVEVAWRLRPDDLAPFSRGGGIPAPRSLDYDTLIVAGGSRYSYFGHEEWREHAAEVKSLESAIALRSRLLAAFEAAEAEPDAPARAPWLTFVVVGGGPTGVELAGALAEISRQTIARDFRAIDPTRARVILLEGGARVLAAFPESLSRRAQDALEQIGVEVRARATVTRVTADAVWLGGEQIRARTVLWAAGVAAAPLARTLGVELDRSGRVPVEPDLSIPGHPEAFVIGDMSVCRDERGVPLPGLAPVAIQQGRHAADNVLRRLSGRPTRAFRYRDRGTMATIGRAKAVAVIGGVKLSGLVAWLAWLFVHIMFLIGFRNRFLVLFEWAWAYLTWQRGARLITGPWRGRDR